MTSKLLFNAAFQKQTYSLTRQLVNPSTRQPVNSSTSISKDKMIKHNKNRFVPLLVSIGVVVGIMLGSFFANHFSGNRLSIINNSSNKIIDLFHLIDDQYVDTINIPDLVEKAMPQILKELDPHSTYISASKVEESMQDLKGSFSGIGVQFTLYKDTIRVVKVVKGGPSESVGIQAGDRIINIDGKPYVGDTISNDGTMKRLKGPKGSVARLGIKRAGQKKLLSFSITRGDVPVKTVDAAYMASPTIGYIRVTSFGDTTYAEFIAALTKLQTMGFSKLILDLRGNPGGYMETAVQMVNEFLPKNSLIVYTEGRKSPRKEYRTDGRGAYQSLPLVVLVDENSASASEIFAGAIQDNDRGTIIGRRSFGKGLVQVPIEFPDGSMLRLTTARYYTPSGRCVQKPYKPGDEEDYEADLLLRAEHGEYFSADSIHTSGEKFKTRLGRTVYGGGGIVPDIFVARDTLGMTSYFKEAYLNGLLFQYAYDFVDKHRAELSQCNGLNEVTAVIKKKNIIEGFASYAERAGLKRRNLMIQRSHKLLTTYITSAIIGDLLDDSEAAEYANQTDKAVLQAIALLAANKSVPSVGKQQAMLSTKLHNNLYYALATNGCSALALTTGYETNPQFAWGWQWTVQPTTLCAWLIGRSSLSLPFALQSFSSTRLPLINSANADYNNILALCYRKWTFAWS